jgi:hypothetical protein
MGGGIRIGTPEIEHVEDVRVAKLVLEEKPTMSSRGSSRSGWPGGVPEARMSASASSRREHRSAAIRDAVQDVVGS